MRLKGKVAIITGAGSGIGRAAALRFAEEGARVVVAELVPELGEKTEAQVRDRDGECQFVPCDITDADSVENLIKTTVATFGGVDVLYNNAGGSRDEDGPVHEVDVNEWWRTMRVDLFGTFLVCRFGVPAMLERGGSVINTSSAAALLGIAPGGRSAYSAAKGGIISLTRAMAASYADRGIRVNALAPAGTATDRIRASFQRRGRELPVEDGPAIPALNQPVDIANAAVFLASDEARTITGTVLPVDGGSTSTRRMPTSRS